MKGRVQEQPQHHQRNGNGQEHFRVFAFVFQEVELLPGDLGTGLEIREVERFAQRDVIERLERELSRFAESTRGLGLPSPHETEMSRVTTQLHADAVIGADRLIG